jgi:hypothetical protein
MAESGDRISRDNKIYRASLPWLAAARSSKPSRKHPDHAERMAAHAARVAREAPPLVREIPRRVVKTVVRRVPVALCQGRDGYWYWRTKFGVQGTYWPRFRLAELDLKEHAYLIARMHWRRVFRRIKRRATSSSARGGRSLSLESPLAS